MLKITNEVLEQYAQKVKNDPKYGSENKLIDQALKENPLNTNISTVAMKICLIDLTNRTNLSRNLGTEDGLYKLSDTIVKSNFADKIVKSNFDERVKNGDLTLVSELSEWTKKEIGKNLFSFISKYCLYHNVHCYDRDDYAIFDSVLSQNLGKYIDEKDYKKITGKTLFKNSFEKMRKESDYSQYMKIIDHIIKQNNITVDKPRRKLDWFIWYKNKNNEKDA
ncbi:MAG: hypothetical protein IJV35_05005 [Neisseriaceae bacterium]|nr:hypothetical protein [Neisseriaceae bacterium]